MPTVLLVGFKDSLKVSTRIETKYLFLQSLEKVHCLIVPLKGLCSINLIPSLNLGTKIHPSITLMCCGTLKEFLDFLDLNFGYFAFFLKKFLKID